MESDFGCVSHLSSAVDDDSDWEQNYANYYDGWVEAEEVIEEERDGPRKSIEDLLSSDEIRKNSTSRKRKKKRNVPDHLHRPQKKLKKKKRNKWKSGVELFYTEVLSWRIDLLAKGNRSSLRLPSLPTACLTFDTFDIFSSVVGQVALEETRAAIFQGLQSPSDGFFLDLCEEPRSTKASDKVIPIRFFVRSGCLDSIRPGWIIYLRPCNLKHANSLDKRRNGWKTTLGCHDGLSDGVLGTLALGKHSFEYQGNGSIVMWVHSEAFFRAVNLRNDGSRDPNVPTHWVGYAIDSVITQQRIVSAANERGTFPFVRKFLGQKEATHIKFSFDETDHDEDDNVDSHASQPCFGDEEKCYIDPNHPLDNSQMKALIKSISSIEKGGALELIQGPPGCGKTYFIIQMLYNLFKKKKRILVCAPSNKAISVIVEQYCDRNTGHWKDNLIVSIGVEEKFDKCHVMSDTKQENETCIVNITSYWMSKICGLQHHCATTMSLLRTSNSETLSGILLPASVVDALQLVINPKNVLQTLVYTYAHNVANAFHVLGTCFNACLEFLSSAYVRDKRSKGICKSCVRRLVREIFCLLRSEYTLLDSTIKVALNQFYSADMDVVVDCRIIRASVEKLNSSIKKSLETLSKALELFLESSDEQLLRSIEHTGDQLWSDISLMSSVFVLPESVDCVVNNLLLNASIVCCTLSTAGCGAMKSTTSSFDALVVDEAGQCLEGELLIACALNPSNLILVGDPQQLPATVLSMEVQQKGLGSSTMQRLMTPSELFSCQSLMLCTQYRMHPAICQYPNHRFYGGKLINSSAVVEREGLLRDHWLSEYPVLFLNISRQENVGSHRVSVSRYNIAEAEVIKRLLDALDKEIRLRQCSRVVEVGVITFYSAQVSVIRDHVNHIPSSGGKLRVKVMSVDSFQGSESDIIILSFVRCNDQNVVGFLKDFHRLNVALTRAKHNLIMIGSADTLRSSDCSDLQSLIREVGDRGVLQEHDHDLFGLNSIN